MSKAFTAIMAVIVLVLSYLLYQEHRQRIAAENQAGSDSTRVLSAIFTIKQDIRVATLSGDMVARSANDGLLFHTEQTTRAPYVVGYFVNLARVNYGDYKWNPDSKTIDVKIGDVIVDAPNIDMSKAVVLQNGVWVSRTAGISMQHQAAERLSAKSAEFAKSNENMGKARKAAIDTITKMVRKPLAAAGLGDVKVNVHFLWEGDEQGGQMDRSRSLSQVFGLSR